MMLVVYVALLVVASAATYVSLTRRVDERLGGTVALAVWARLTPAAFNLETATGGSVIDVAADGPTAILTGTLAMLMLVFVLGSSFDLIPDREETRYGNNNSELRR